ncbi:MAG: sigma-70 family RNA polymerase sigma factor [bacterium]
MTKKLNQKILIFKIQTKKDPEAFAKLYDHFIERIYRFVYFKVSKHEEAEDITSEVFLKAWNYINEGNKVDSFSGLLYKIARNSIIDLYRSKSNKFEVGIDNADAIRQLSSENEKGSEIQDQVDDKMQIEKIIKALHNLKQEYREIITLRYIDELRISEIAHITGKSQVSVRVTLFRSIKKLKEIMESKK